ncbi:MAG: M1 family aminopeptidase [Draconibacterium sp.]
MKQILILTYISLVFATASFAQDDLIITDKIVATEQKSIANKLAFTENENYASTDFTYQRLEWQIDPAQRYIAGKITTYFRNNAEARDSIQLDMHADLQPDSVTRGSEKLAFTHEGNKLNIRFNHMISPGQIDSFSVYYQGIPPGSGFGSFETDTHGPDETPVLWTLSEPYGAMEWWPCKQSLADKIDSIDIVVTTPYGYRTASNGIVVSDTIENGQRTMHWKHRYPIATYLIAIAVTNYAVYSDTLYLNDNQTIDILNYVYPENLDTVKLKTSVTPEIMAFFNQVIGEYPFADEKYGHAQFGWGGGMEHQTMSFMGNFRYDIIAHELAHQWFGDYITLASWQDIWLNEGFATYLTGLSFEKLKPEAWPDWKKALVENITSETGGSVFVDDTTNVNRIFNGRLSYNKGTSLLHMLRWIVGEEAFFTGLRNYFNDQAVANGFATTKQFIQHIETAADTTLSEFLQDWFYGEGYPIFGVNYSQDENNNLSISLSQTTSHSSVELFELPVPVRVYNIDRSDSADFRLNQTINDQTFVVNPRFQVSELKVDPDYRLVSKTAFVVGIPTISETDIEVIPNPVRESLNLKISSNIRPKSIQIFSMNGILVKSFNVNSQTLDVSDLINAVYVLVVSTSKGDIKTRFIKQ